MSLRAIDEWCDAETRFWTDVYAGSRDFEAEFIRLNEVSPTIFLFEISHDRVTIRNKPGYEINQGRVSGEGQPAMRARHYHQFFESCLTLSGQKMQTTLAVDVHDLAVTRSSGPLFCFQKKTGDVNILLPDIDFMQNGWYVKRHREPEFDAKRLEATFIGSSTGGGILSALDIAQARPERLRLARELVGHPRIKFLIGAAVQCDSEQTARLLQQQPYYTRPVPWENQLQSRFLLSVDGNGATCSRIVKALSSGSILLKMASENQLYYFHGLEPWRHYIPVRSISDIEYVIERAPRLQLAKMIAQANEFVTNALSVEAVHDYGAKLLARYAKQIFGTLVEPPKPSPAQTSTSIIPIQQL